MPELVLPVYPRATPVELQFWKSELKCVLSTPPVDSPVGVSGHRLTISSAKIHVPDTQMNRAMALKRVVDLKRCFIELIWLKFFAFLYPIRVESNQQKPIITFLCIRLGLCLNCKEVTKFIHCYTFLWFSVWIITKRYATRSTLTKKAIKIISKYSSTLLTRWLNSRKISGCQQIITRKRGKGKRSSSNRENHNERKNILSKFLFHRQNLLFSITSHIV